MTSGGSCKLIFLQIETDSNGVCQQCLGAAGATVVGTAEALSATNQGEFVQIVALARHLRGQCVGPSGLTAYNARRLVALDKQPRIRSIGIKFSGKLLARQSWLLLDRMCSKTVNVCTGQLRGGNLQRMQCGTPFTTLPVETTNAFNRLNQEVVLQNAYFALTHGVTSK